MGLRVLFVLRWLWQVPADLQNEVLMSLLESDGDVVDYLLRRKASQNLWDPSTLACEAQCIVTSLTLGRTCLRLVGDQGPSLWTSLWMSDACPVIPPRCRVEMCLLMTTIPPSWQTDWWGNIRMTVIRSPTASPDCLPRFTLPKVPPDTLLQTKVKDFFLDISIVNHNKDDM